MYPLELSLRPALKGTSPGAKEPMHENYSSAEKASASLCLAAYSGEHLPLVHRASRSGTVSLRQRSKREGKREHVTEGHEQRERRKKRQHMQLAGSHGTYQTEIESRDTDIHKGQQETPVRGVSAEP